MSHPINDSILDDANWEFIEAMSVHDDAAVRSVIARLEDIGFDRQARDMEAELYELYDAWDA